MSRPLKPLQYGIVESLGYSAKLKVGDLVVSDSLYGGWRKPEEKWNWFTIHVKLINPNDLSKLEKAIYGI